MSRGVRVRSWLYGSLVALASVTAVAVLVTEATKGQCSIVCGWQIPILVVGVGAAILFVFVGASTIAYEVGRAALGRRHP